MKKVADFLALVCAVLGLAALMLQWTSTPSESMAGTYVGLAFGVLGLPTTYFWFYANHMASLAKQLPLEGAPATEPRQSDPNVGDVMDDGKGITSLDGALAVDVDVWFTHEWRAFDDCEMWYAGLALWLWEPSWFEPRLAVADPEEGGDWRYLDGSKIGEYGERYPTHCCPPMQPTPPI